MIHFVLTTNFLLSVDTLVERINRWKKSADRQAPSLSQIRVAISISDALCYLHSKNIVFRDLKPANVGFDSAGVLKLFDFGFAIGMNEPSTYPESMCSGTSVLSEETHLLYDKCGTPRYMAPEVGLGIGYGLPADVYSFGILLWEVCALNKPFSKVKSAEQFYKTVHEKGSRPKISKHWPTILTEVITQCWSGEASDRPPMTEVKTLLSVYAQELKCAHGHDSHRVRNSLISSITLGSRRSTG